MDKKIKKIIAKVRELLKNNEKYKPLLKEKAEICIIEGDGELRISKIKIGYYDNIVITENKICYRPEFGRIETLYEYKNYDELLKIKV